MPASLPRPAPPAFSPRRSTTFPTATSSPWPSSAGRSPAWHLDQWPQPRLRPLDAGAARRRSADRVRRSVGGPRQRARHPQGARPDPRLRPLAGSDQRRGLRRPAAQATARGARAHLRAGLGRRGLPAATGRPRDERHGKGLDRRRGSGRSGADHRAWPGAHPRRRGAGLRPVGRSRAGRGGAAGAPSGFSPARRAGSPRSTSARSRRC